MSCLATYRSRRASGVRAHPPQLPPGAIPPRIEKNPPRTSGAVLLAAMTGKDNSDRVQNNDAIKERRHIFQIKEIVFELANGILDAGSVVILHLCPACDPGAHAVTLIVIGNLFPEFVDEFRPLRAWPHEAHFSADHVNELGKFVEAVFPQPPPDPRHPRIVRGGPLRTGSVFGVGSHGP